jgi:hypothetical protein
MSYIFAKCLLCLHNIMWPVLTFRKPCFLWLTTRGNTQRHVNVSELADGDLSFWPQHQYHLSLVPKTAVHVNLTAYWFSRSEKLGGGICSVGKPCYILVTHIGVTLGARTVTPCIVFIYIYIFVRLQLGFNPVAVVQQYNRQVTQITHKHNTKTQK